MTQSAKTLSKPAAVSHLLNGIWTEVRNRFLTSSVLYTIEERHGRIRVTGVDKRDGVALRVSSTSWDGDTLRFVTLFPPTKHKAAHEFRLARNGRAEHVVKYSDKYGDHAINEVWRKLA